MKIKKRQTKIVEALQHSKRASVDELAILFNKSHETIRRDLTKLANAGLIQKIHGGAVLPRSHSEGSFRQREILNIEAKKLIAKAAASLLKPRQTLFIDTGSTTLYFAEALAQTAQELTIISNSIEIIQKLSTAQTSNQVFLVGGEYKYANQETIGTIALEQIRNFHAHYAFLTVSALNTQHGAMDFNHHVARVGKTMIEQAETLVVLADHTKFNHIASFEVCPLSRIDHLVCNIAPDTNLQSALDTAQVNTIIAQTETNLS